MNNDSAVLTLNRQGSGANTQPQLKVYITFYTRPRQSETPTGKREKPVGVNSLGRGTSEFLSP